MDITIPKLLLQSFSNDMEEYQLNILNDIHTKFLADHLTFEELKKEFETKPKIKFKRKLIINKPLDNEIRCEAKVWSNGTGSRCKNKKTDGIDYCIKHFYKKNYGRFDE